MCYCVVDVSVSYVLLGVSWCVIVVLGLCLFQVLRVCVSLLDCVALVSTGLGWFALQGHAMNTHAVFFKMYCTVV